MFFCFCFGRVEDFSRLLFCFSFSPLFFFFALDHFARKWQGLLGAWGGGVFFSRFFLGGERNFLVCLFFLVSNFLFSLGRGGGAGWGGDVRGNGMYHDPNGLPNEVGFSTTTMLWKEMKEKQKPQNRK